MKKALICYNEGLGKFDVGIFVRSLFLDPVILVNVLLVLIEGPRGDEGLSAHVAGDGVLMILEVGLECGAAVETLVTFVTFNLLPVADILMDF